MSIIIHSNKANFAISLSIYDFANESKISNNICMYTGSVRTLCYVEWRQRDPQDRKSIDICNAKDMWDQITLICGNKVRMKVQVLLGFKLIMRNQGCPFSTNPSSIAIRLVQWFTQQ